MKSRTDPGAVTARRIICRDHEVRGLLDGSRTQLRRVARLDSAGRVKEPGWHRLWYADDPGAVLACPFGQPGDRIWVAEAHAILPRTAYRQSIGTGTIDQREHPTDGYSACVFREGFDRSGAPHWRSSTQMPEWAARLRPVLVERRLQRLWGISAADARAEGIQMPAPQAAPADFDHDCVVSFRKQWDRDHGPESWQSNPYVWALTVAVSS